MTLPGGYKVRTSTGIWAVVAALGLGVAIVVAVVITGGVTAVSTPWIVSILGLIATTVPSILAMLSAGDVKAKLDNGHIQSEVTKALESNQVITRDGPAATAALLALKQLLEQNTQVTKENTETVREANGNGGGQAL